MKRIIIPFVFASLCFSVGLMAQNISDLPSGSFPFNLGGQTMMRVDHRYEGVKGTYTLFEQFTRGTVELNKGKFSNVLINYDAFNDNLLAMNDKINDPVQMRKDVVVKFVMTDVSGQEFVFTKQNLDNAPTFLLNIVQDTVSLYCRIVKNIKKADIGGAYNVSEKRYDEFVTVNTYYVNKGDGRLQELPKNKKGILQVFPEYDDQLSAYLKKNKIDFNDYSQMKQLMAHINSL